MKEVPATVLSNIKKYVFWSIVIGVIIVSIIPFLFTLRDYLLFFTPYGHGRIGITKTYQISCDEIARGFYRTLLPAAYVVFVGALWGMLRYGCIRKRSVLVAVLVLPLLLTVFNICVIKHFWGTELNMLILWLP